MTQLAQAQPRPDFRIPAPVAPSQPASPPAPALAPAPPPRTSTAGRPMIEDPWRAPTTTEIAIGAAIFVVLAVVSLFVRVGVKNYLRDHRAPIDAASAASWTLFAALLLTGLVIVSATIGNLWTQYLVTGPALAFCLFIFVIFAIQFVRAPRRAR